jgi:hypothetical protein
LFANLELVQIPPPLLSPIRSLLLLKNDEEEPEVIYTAIADYTSLETTELSFVHGDILQVLRVGDGGWWFARAQRTSQEGWVPGSYLEEVNQDVNSE